MPRFEQVCPLWPNVVSDCGWLAVGGVGSTTAVGLAALARGAAPIGMVTAMPQFAHAEFDSASSFVVGGHDLRRVTLSEAAYELHKRSNVFSHELLTIIEPTLAAWSANVRPGVTYRVDEAIGALIDRPRRPLRSHTTRSD